MVNPHLLIDWALHKAHIETSRDDVNELEERIDNFIWDSGQKFSTSLRYKYKEHSKLKSRMLDVGMTYMGRLSEFDRFKKTHKEDLIKLKLIKEEE